MELFSIIAALCRKINIILVPFTICLVMWYQKISEDNNE